MARYCGILTDEHKNQFFPACYFPIGYIYISTVNTNPSTWFGGTWEKIEGKFLLSASSSYTAGATGGTATHTHTQGATGSTAITAAMLPSHRHSIPALSGTAASAGSHAHSVLGYPGSGGSSWGLSSATGANSKDSDPSKVTGGILLGAATSAGSHQHNVSTTASNTGYIGSGSGHTHTNPTTASSSSMPPYLVVYMWKRTA